MPSASRNLVRPVSYSSANSEECGTPSNSMPEKINELLAEKLPALKFFPKGRFSHS